MVFFTKEEMREQMNDPDHIRNMSVIAHVDHGKSTLTDSLVAHAGIIKAESAGDARATDTRADEQERCITIKSTGISLYYEYASPILEDAEKVGHLINLIDSPGHVDFSSEVTAALRVTDGALVVVDAVSGVSVQTETVLRQALQERVKPVLMLNKLDRVFKELQLTPEDAYESFRRNIEHINSMISIYGDDTLGDVSCDPVAGSVAFGSGLQAWAFTLNRFAIIYSKKFGFPRDKFLKKLWGDNYWDAKTKKWRKKDVSADGRPLKRAFCEFIIEPLYRVFNMGAEETLDNLWDWCDKNEIEMNREERSRTKKEVLKTVLRKWLPAAEALLDMIVEHLPSPRAAQKYRASALYTGPVGDEAYNGIVNCDPNGPVMVYVSKMVPSADNSRFVAFGRVFSGTIYSQQRVRIYGSNYVFGGKEDFYEKTVTRTVIMMAGRTESVESIPCGNTVGLVGIDKWLLKAGTITNLETAYPIRSMKFSVAPVVRQAVRPKNSADLGRLAEGLHRLSKSDPCVVVEIDDETGESIIAGVGELHLEICIKDLRDDFAKVPIIVTDPIVSFRETVVGTSSVQCLAKSANGLNRLFGIAKPLSQELTEAIEGKDIVPNPTDVNAQVRKLVDEYGWELNQARSIWAYGPETRGPNVLVDISTGVQYLNEIKDSVKGGFEWVTAHGVLCEEPCRGVGFYIEDGALHGDAVHRGGNQILPAARNLFYASQLSADPTLLHPMYVVDITIPQDVRPGVYQVLTRRNGRIYDEEPREGTYLVQIKAHLAVLDSFRFDADLRAATSGKAFPQMSFSHWEILDGDINDTTTRVGDVVKKTRERKGMPGELPPLSKYLDKL
eukprot:TRINITY_DN2629_c0_g1_i1.p1 TRINITY_DN2629_c0_g1~~TRINITY_DN2629_c0_g1_i1.p1  ORF type:complete len:841 (-),score=180.66 TRINITY_DN2629_c0_g1_i1:39-2561(-)